MTDQGEEIKMRMTSEMLQELGSCSDYTSRFIRLFPITDERYVDGVEVTADVCAENATEFDWGWAASVMLTEEGRQEYNRRVSNGSDDDDMKAIYDDETRSHDTYNEDVAAWREKHQQEYDSPDWNTPQVARDEYNQIQRRYGDRNEAIQVRRSQHVARTFGSLFERPELRSQRVQEAFDAGEVRREQKEQDRLRIAESSLQDVQNQIEYWTTEPAKQITYWTDEPPKKLPELAKQLTNVKEKVDALRERVKRGEARRAQQRLDEATATVQRAQEDLAKAQAELDELSPLTEAVETVKA